MASSQAPQPRRTWRTPSRRPPALRSHPITLQTSGPLVANGPPLRLIAPVKAVPQRGGGAEASDKRCKLVRVGRFRLVVTLSACSRVSGVDWSQEPPMKRLATSSWRWTTTSSSSVWTGPGPAPCSTPWPTATSSQSSTAASPSTPVQMAPCSTPPGPSGVLPAEPGRQADRISGRRGCIRLTGEDGWRVINWTARGSVSVSCVLNERRCCINTKPHAHPTWAQVRMPQSDLGHQGLWFRPSCLPRRAG